MMASIIEKATDGRRTGGGMSSRTQRGSARFFVQGFDLVMFDQDIIICRSCKEKTAFEGWETTNTIDRLCGLLEVRNFELRWSSMKGGKEMVVRTYWGLG